MDKKMNKYDYGDAIVLNDLRVKTLVGIWDWERKIRQVVSIDLEMGVDITRASTSDSIEDTLNYKNVAKRVQSFVGESEFRLVETLAERIAELVLSEFQLPWIQVYVKKPGAIRGAENVGIRIRRYR
tara:strand:- start:6 stop:386 length:381 start_codon:yes stop_codon:yes gene_type:complete